MANSSTYNSNEIIKRGTNDGTRFNLNDTMPLGGLGSSSLTMLRQKSMENGVKIVQGEGEVDNSKLNEKINMEAYQAYYNTNETSAEPDN